MIIPYKLYLLIYSLFNLWPFWKYEKFFSRKKSLFYQLSHRRVLTIIKNIFSCGHCYCEEPSIYPCNGWMADASWCPWAILMGPSEMWHNLLMPLLYTSRQTTLPTTDWIVMENVWKQFNGVIKYYFSLTLKQT